MQGKIIILVQMYLTGGLQIICREICYWVVRIKKVSINMCVDILVSGSNKGGGNLYT